MLNTRFATGLILVGSVFGFIHAAPALAQSALAQQGAAQQSTAKPSAKSSTSAKPAANPTAAPAKKSAPKPLVYVMDSRNSNKTDANKTADATATSKPTNASVKTSTATSSKTSAGKTAPASAATDKPLSADLTKAFQQNCPSVALTDSKSKAAYEVMFERDPASKGVKSAFGLHKGSKIEVTSKTGKELFSETGHSTGQLVKDACTAIGTPGTKIAKN